MSRPDPAEKPPTVDNRVAKSVLLDPCDEVVDRLVDVDRDDDATDAVYCDIDYSKQLHKWYKHHASFFDLK